MRLRGQSPPIEGSGVRGWGPAESRLEAFSRVVNQSSNFLHLLHFQYQINPYLRSHVIHMPFGAYTAATPQPNPLHSWSYFLVTSP